MDELINFEKKMDELFTFHVPIVKGKQVAVHAMYHVKGKDVVELYELFEKLKDIVQNIPDECQYFDDCGNNYVENYEPIQDESRE